MPDDNRTTTPEVLTEFSLADAMALICADTALPLAKKQAWQTALRSLAWAMGWPLESLACRMTALRWEVGKLKAAALGWSDKTLANHKSNLKAAIRHVTRTADIPTRGTPLDGEWSRLLAAVADVPRRRILASFARYCSHRHVPPPAVDLGVIEQFVAFKETVTFHKGGLAYRRKLIRAWNACVVAASLVSGPELPVPALKATGIAPDWEVFPEGLRTGIEAYLGTLAVPHRLANGKRRRSARASTLATRRRELVAFARKAVAAGVPMNRLTSLSAMLADDVVTPTLEAYLRQTGKRASTYVIDLAVKLLSVARATGASASCIERLDEIRSSLEQERGPVLTEKNLKVIRQVMSTDLWPRVLALPPVLMQRALRLRNRQPKKAWALATVALQMQILTQAPIRIGNLLAIRLEHNLLRLGQRKYQLHFPAYDVKNRAELDFPLDGVAAELLDTYLEQFRPKLAGLGKGDFLFPRTDGSNRSSTHASQAIAQLLEKEVGYRITAHQFRHAAAALILKHRPGDYEFARRVLGHRNIVTTQRFYAGLESFAAAKLFNGLVESSLAVARQAKSKPAPRRAAIQPGRVKRSK